MKLTAIFLRPDCDIEKPSMRVWSTYEEQQRNLPAPWKLTKYGECLAMECDVIHK